MSKVLIDLSILNDAIDDFRYARDTATDRDDYKRFSDQVEQLESAIKDQKRFSVLEWHDVTEIPDDYEEILVRFRSNPDEVYVKTAVVYDIETDHPYWLFEHGGSVDDVDEWAYLPE